MKKTLCLLLSMVLVFGLFAGCAAKEETAAPEAPAAPEETAPEQENVPEEAGKTPEIWSEIAYGPVEGKSKEDYSIAGVFGAVNPFSDPFLGAANQAAAELGIMETEFNAPQGWVQNDQNVILDSLVSSGIQGIYMMPSDPVAGNEQITKMVDAGVNVICVGGPPKTPSKAVMTLATDVYTAAYEGTKNLIEAMGGKGGVVGLNGAVTDPNTQARMEAIEAACAEYPDVVLVQQIGDIDDSELSVSAIENILAAKGEEINGFISTAYYPSVALATILDNEKYAHIHAIGCDTDEVVLDAISRGVMDGTMSQNPWGQAYLATVSLKMLKDGWTYNGDFMVDSGSFYINADNCDKVAEIQMTQTMAMCETWLDNWTAPAK